MYLKRSNKTRSSIFVGRWKNTISSPFWWWVISSCGLGICRHFNLLSYMSRGSEWRSGQQYPALTIAGKGVCVRLWPRLLSPSQELDLKPVYLIFQALYSRSPCIGFPFLHLCIWIDNLVWSLPFWLSPSSFLWRTGLWNLLCDFTHDNYN